MTERVHSLSCWSVNCFTHTRVRFWFRMCTIQSINVIINQMSSTKFGNWKVCEPRWVRVQQQQQRRVARPAKNRYHWWLSINVTGRHHHIPSYTRRVCARAVGIALACIQHSTSNSNTRSHPENGWFILTHAVCAYLHIQYSEPVTSTHPATKQLDTIRVRAHGPPLAITVTLASDCCCCCCSLLAVPWERTTMHSPEGQ